MDGRRKGRGRRQGHPLSRPLIVCSLSYVGTVVEFSKVMEIDFVLVVFMFLVIPCAPLFGVLLFRNRAMLAWWVLRGEHMNQNCSTWKKGSHIYENTIQIGGASASTWKWFNVKEVEGPRGSGLRDLSRPSAVGAGESGEIQIWCG